MELLQSVRESSCTDVSISYYGTFLVTTANHYQEVLPMAPQHAVKLTIWGTVLFMPPFLLWLKNVLLSPVLEELYLEETHLDSIVWDDVLEHINLPSLHICRFSGRFTPPAVLRFLLVHDTYNVLDTCTFHPLDMHMHSSTPVCKPRLEYLPDIHAPDSYLICLLGVVNLGSLTTINVNVTLGGDMRALATLLHNIARANVLERLYLLLPNNRNLLNAVVNALKDRRFCGACQLLSVKILAVFVRGAAFGDEIWVSLPFVVDYSITYERPEQLYKFTVFPPSRETCHLQQEGDGCQLSTCRGHSFS